MARPSIDGTTRLTIAAAGGLNGMLMRSVPEGYLSGEDAVRMAVQVLASWAQHWGSSCSGPDSPAIAGHRRCFAGHCMFPQTPVSGQLFVSVVAGGEGNHSWHHADLACPRHGRRVVLGAEAVAAGIKPEHGWHPDATWRLIQLLTMLGLIYSVKQPKATIHFADKQLMPSQSLRLTHREWHINEPEKTQALLAL